MKDTESYRIFYKEEGTDKYIVIDNIEGTNGRQQMDYGKDRYL